MFTVKNNDGEEYRVYSVRETVESGLVRLPRGASPEAKIEFLIYNGSWQWVQADQFEPV